MRGLRELEKAEEEVAGVAATSNWSITQGLLFAGGIGLLLVASVATGLLFYVRSHAYTEAPDISSIPPVDEQIDQWPADFTYDFWQHEVEQKLDLGAWQAPDFVYQRRVAAILSIMAYVSLALAFCGAASAILSFFLRSRASGDRTTAPPKPAKKHTQATAAKE